jgi:type I restriction enzyme M protein
MPLNILQYESDIWSSADSLRSAGLKQSDFPKYMMPFFALRMVESRLIREHKRLSVEFGITGNNQDDYIEYFKTVGLGYNDYVIRENKTLSDICANDKTFESDFKEYLGAFDTETRHLLGVDKSNDEEKYLDISGVCGILRGKKILFSIVLGWSKIDLEPFDNSEITTLEEHIKRKWADISAETAGEQYTPDDIIALISDIVANKIQDNDDFLTIYDPTSGGGNLLFGIEDKIKAKFRRPIKTHGMDWNSSLYALAKIESRFRVDSDIKYGNTLTDTAFIDKLFDVVVANPPYGVDWKDYRKAIETDKTGRFVALPSISDGQLLFDQHIVYHLDNDGIGVVVNNGSSLFSGDAGSGESTIRKYFFDNDWVEAIIQMPVDEFFNTGIYTYLWVFNKNKSAERKDKIILIDGSSKYVPLKKSKGKKRREMSEDNRAEIIKALVEFQDNDFARVFDKWHFYYNKQSIMLTNVDSEGKFIEEKIKLKPTQITQTGEEGTFEITTFELTDFDKTKYNNIVECFDATIAPAINAFDYKENQLIVEAGGKFYTWNSDEETIVEMDCHPSQNNAKGKRLGCGRIQIKSTFKKATKTADAKYSITVELVTDLQKDYEIIPFSPNEEENKASIAAFMAKYVSRPFEYIENTIGVEINFNKVFYKPEKLEDILDILSNIKQLGNDLLRINSTLSLDEVLLHGLNPSVQLKDSGIEWIGMIPEQWEVKRFKDIAYSITGLTYSPDDIVDEGEGVLVLRSGNIQNGELSFNDNVFVNSNIGKNLFVRKGDILLCSRNGSANLVGKSAYIDKNYNYTWGAFMIVVRSKMGRYLFYALNSELFKRNMGLFQTSTVNQLTSKMLDNMAFLVPTKEEQIEIVDYLDTKTTKIDTILTNISEQFNKLKLLRKTLINDVVTGKIKVTED